LFIFDGPLKSNNYLRMYGRDLQRTAGVPQRIGRPQRRCEKITWRWRWPL